MKTQKTVAAIRHVGFEDLGTFAFSLIKRGYTIQYFDAGIHDLRGLANAEYDLVVILGGPLGAYDEARFPFLSDQLRVIEQRVQCNFPLLGVCLGAQLIAKSLGAKVYGGIHKEIGWGKLSYPDGSGDLFAPVLAANDDMVFHWHGDTFDLPHGAKLLASSDHCTHQAFSYGQAVLALQFHMEFAYPQLERWLIGHIHELDSLNLSLPRLRADSLQYGPGLIPAADAMLNAWCSQWESLSHA